MRGLRRRAGSLPPQGARVRLGARRLHGPAEVDGLREVYGGVRIVTFVTRDLARARAFYVDQLGLSVMKEERGRLVMVNAGTFRLCIERADEAHPARGGGASLHFRVKNVAKTAKELDTRGIAFETFTGPRIGDYLETSDPDGYRLVFAERL